MHLLSVCVYAFVFLGIHKRDDANSVVQTNGLAHSMTAIKNHQPPAISVVTFRWDNENTEIKGAPNRYIYREREKKEGQTQRAKEKGKSSNQR